MKICHVTSAHNRYDDRIFIKECKSLHKAGLEVNLLVHDQLENEKKEGISIYSTHIKYRSRIKRILLGNRKMIKLAANVVADVYHLHDPELLLIARKLKRMGKLVIFDSHENYALQIAEKEYIPVLFRPLISKIYQQVEKRLLKNVDASIIPCSFAGINPLEGKTRLVEYINGYPLMSVFYDCYDQDIEKEKMICYAGGLSEQRGIRNLIKAAALAKVKLVLAGEFSTEEFQQEIMAMPEMEYVEYKGKLDWAELREVYQKAQIGMSILLDKGQYSIMDNLPTKVYEYMSMGLPVIISDSPYNQIVQRECAGICVDPSNVEEIADVITRLTSDLEKAKNMGLNGRRLIREKWNWEEESKKLVNLYSSLI
ncbi:MAG: glycosyltransferase [Candidatus Gastranaerophilales bacterium]|nr:glycosyltransferase [Candidatus Gastranaerophilales bacterium]